MPSKRSHSAPARRRLPAVLSVVQRADAERAAASSRPRSQATREALDARSRLGARARGRQRHQSALRNTEFEDLVSRRSACSARKNYVDAQERFQTALAMRPGSREAAERLAQAEREREAGRDRSRGARALAFERRELWDQAIALHRSVLGVRSETLLFAQHGPGARQARKCSTRSSPTCIDNPSLLFGDTVLADAQVARVGGCGHARAAAQS